MKTRALLVILAAALPLSCNQPTSGIEPAEVIK
jgi:hypothetical protein